MHICWGGEMDPLGSRSFHIDLIDRENRKWSMNIKVNNETLSRLSTKDVLQAIPFHRLPENIPFGGVQKTEWELQHDVIRSIVEKALQIAPEKNKSKGRELTIDVNPGEGDDVFTISCTDRLNLSSKIEAIEMQEEAAPGAQSYQAVHIHETTSHKTLIEHFERTPDFGTGLLASIRRSLHWMFIKLGKKFSSIDRWWKRIVGMEEMPYNLATLAACTKAKGDEVPLGDALKYMSTMTRTTRPELSKRMREASKIERAIRHAAEKVHKSVKRANNKMKRKALFAASWAVIKSKGQFEEDTVVPIALQSGGNALIKSFKKIHQAIEKFTNKQLHSIEEKLSVLTADAGAMLLPITYGSKVKESLLLAVEKSRDGTFTATFYDSPQMIGDGGDKQLIGLSHEDVTKILKKGIETTLLSAATAVEEPTEEGGEKKLGFIDQLYKSLPLDFMPLVRTPDNLSASDLFPGINFSSFESLIEGLTDSTEPDQEPISLEDIQIDPPLEFFEEVTQKGARDLDDAAPRTQEALKGSFSAIGSIVSRTFAARDKALAVDESRGTYTDIALRVRLLFDMCHASKEWLKEPEFHHEVQQTCYEILDTVGLMLKEVQTASAERELLVIKGEIDEVLRMAKRSYPAPSPVPSEPLEQLGGGAFPELDPLPAEVEAGEPASFEFDENDPVVKIVNSDDSARNEFHEAKTAIKDSYVTKGLQDEIGGDFIYNPYSHRHMIHEADVTSQYKRESIFPKLCQLGLTASEEVALIHTLHEQKTNLALYAEAPPP